MVIEIFKFEDRTSDGENFLPIGRDDSPVYFVLYGPTYKKILNRLILCEIAMFEFFGFLTIGM